MENIVEKKHWSVAIRLNHWAMAISIFVLIGTGFLIAEPFTILGGETTLKSSVGDIRFWHILFGVLLAFLFFWRIYLALFSTFRADWKDFLAFTNLPHTIQQIKFYLLIDKKKPPHSTLGSLAFMKRVLPHDTYSILTLYGPMQSLAYLGLLAMVFCIVITGFILMGAGYHAAGLTSLMAWILKPVENLLGGLATVRTIHHVLTWGFILFIVVHVYMAFWYDAVLKEGTLSSMVTGNMFEKRNTSAHEVQFLDVLCKAELLEEAPEVVFLCVVPVDFREMNMEMSPLLQEKFPVMEKLLIEELNRLNVQPVKNHA